MNYEERRQSLQRQRERIFLGTLTAGKRPYILLNFHRVYGFVGILFYFFIYKKKKKDEREISIIVKIVNSQKGTHQLKWKFNELFLLKLL